MTTNEIRVTRSTDRHLTCASCRAAAIAIISAPAALVTHIYDSRETTEPASWSTCQRHAECNARKARAAVTHTVDHRRNTQHGATNT
jgi:hypothetical protein